MAVEAKAIPCLLERLDHFLQFIIGEITLHVVERIEEFCYPAGDLDALLRLLDVFPQGVDLRLQLFGNLFHVLSVGDEEGITETKWVCFKILI